MKSKQCLSTIKSEYIRLTRTEKKVADYILNNYDKVIMQSVAEFASDAGVVGSAVVRCCKSLGFEGYSDMKISLAMELSENKKLNFTPYVSPEDKPDGIMGKVFSANIKTLHDTMEKLDKNVLYGVVEMLARAKTIYIFAVGTSAGLAVDFQYRLMQFGFCAFCLTDVPTMKIATLNMTKDDVAFAISHSGRTIPTIEALKLAGQKGVGTVCLTSYPDSTITRICDLPLCVYSDEIEYPVEAVSARIGHMSVLDSIAISLSAKKYSETLKRSKENKELIDTIRYES